MGSIRSYDTGSAALRSGLAQTEGRGEQHFSIPNKVELKTEIWGSAICISTSDSRFRRPADKKDTTRIMPMKMMMILMILMETPLRLCRSPSNVHALCKYDD